MDREGACPPDSGSNPFRIRRTPGYRGASTATLHAGFVMRGLPEGVKSGAPTAGCNCRPPRRACGIGYATLLTRTGTRPMTRSDRLEMTRSDRLEILFIAYVIALAAGAF